MAVTCPWLGTAGRLGNQLWQIASTIGIAEHLGEPVQFPRWAYEDVFSIPRQFFADDPQGVNVVDAGARYVAHIKEPYRVYLQDYGLWSYGRDTVWQLLQPTPLAYVALHGKAYEEFYKLPKPVVALHVRRGDMATAHERNEEGYHPLRPMTYYVDALEALSGKFASIAVFSDDIAWCQEHFDFAGVPHAYVNGGPARPREHEPDFATAPVMDWMDLFAMTLCDAFILANSTYSWWAAFLSEVKPENIVYPWPWFGPKLADIDASLMFPPGWKKVEHAG